ncbi:type IV secretion protein IcmK [Legionella norrlandica]|uniref:Type IV secretion protein IcmK n=1 Tax=Legionella norrlandica TaxID=1498499 RepID=A0A0A2SN60_9GAMM|nr:type IVB secretion system protein IcmK/DotH [Legionella norrlandica]KGP62565.1 type IV secretion protein IcmK [Legionella norrlandica]
MKKYYQWCKYCLVFGMVSFMSYGVYAADQDDAQQALQQLRLLQQKLAQTPAADVQDANEGANEATPIIGAAQPPSDQTGQVNAPQAAQRNQASTTTEGQVISQDDAEIIDNKAFKDMTRDLYPLNPEQIVRLKQIYQTSEYAKASTAGTPPKPTATSQFVNLSPGSTPPVIRLSQGFVSSLVFLDSTGSPWPISAYDLGDPSAFNIQWDKTSNTLMIQAMKLYNYGNLAVRLKGLNTPVMLTLIPGQKAVDYRVDLRIQGYGPNAKSMPTEEGIPPSANDLLLHVLEGVPPPGSRRLVVSGGDARAWLSNEKMYVRTNLTILSPGWLASMTSADGMHAYEMQKSPVLLVSWHGKVMQLKVEGL